MGSIDRLKIRHPNALVAVAQPAVSKTLAEQADIAGGVAPGRGLEGKP